MNLLEELRERKLHLQQLLQQAHEFGWVNEEELAREVKRIEEEKLTIGVIGQMKAGKSTFLNSFIFGDTILPAASSPMTASLSYITYGPEKKLVAEFYTPDEWSELRMTASRTIDEGLEDSAEGSKIQAAKELVSKSTRISQINKLLGTSKEDSFENLIQYVGAEGQFIAITKSVKLYLPLEYLKGVEIVDTPGFNDPIVSREVRTREFLKQADVALLLLYAGRAFDASDRDILFKDVRNCGAGKVLIGINKYDLNYANGESPQELADLVEKNLRKAAFELQDEAIKTLLEETHPIPFSAGMALLARLPMARIERDEVLRSDYKRYCETFEVSSQEALYKESLVANLNEAVRQVIERDKAEILLRKPVNMLLATGDRLLGDVTKQLGLTENKIKTLESPDDQLEELESQLGKAERKINRKLNTLRGSFEELCQDQLSNLEDQAGEALDRAIDSCRSKADKINWFGTNADRIQAGIEDRLHKLENGTLPGIQKRIVETLKHKGKTEIEEFIQDVEDIVERYLPDEIDAKDIAKQLTRKFSEGSGFSGKSDSGKAEEGGGSEEGFFETALMVIGAPFIGIFAATDALFGGLGREAKDNINAKLSEIRDSFDVSGVKEHLQASLDKSIEGISKALIDELIAPLQKQIEEVRNNKDKKAQMLAEAQAEVKRLRAEKERLTEEVQQIRAQVPTILGDTTQIS